ncbi:hypothetical protein MHM93_01905 [Pseudoalteromonas sp. MM17-2]|uniref:hypothetical protein n=1 Tax=Pseudoalteromonas sp. MM17-2 TaxID=2917753 RepID=UPI001EF65839|nr:hypothetical protein [Pseudoalteromonas sp. MM17-2]MCG7542935.1 hypothetical protein [Pseudoalteromonas sp. MM17-2]
MSQRKLVTLKKNEHIYRAIGQNIHLSYGGVATASVDIYRNGDLLTTTANTDSLGKVRGSFGYQVCEQDSTVCSTTVTVSL